MKDQDNKNNPHDVEPGVQSKVEGVTGSAEGSNEFDGGGQSAVNAKGATGFHEGSEAQNLEDEYVEDVQEKSDVSSIKSLVGASPKQNMAMLAILILVLGGASYYFLYGNKHVPAPTESIPLSSGPGKVGSVGAPEVSGSDGFSSDAAVNANQFPGQFYNTPNDNVQASHPSLPQPTQAVKPPASAPTPAAHAPTVPAQPQLNGAGHSQNPLLPNAQQAAQEQTAKLKSSIMLVSGSGGGGGGAKPGSAEAAAAASSALRSNSFTPSSSAATISQLTSVGDMSSLVVQGKILEAVLETPVNTNYPGPIRALISRDVYSEMGENILIPRGSRVIGTIVGGYQAGNTRVIIAWNRIILPNGYDMQVLGAPGVGKLGMIGVEGIVDRQLWNTLGNAILLSTINIGLADVAQNAFNIGSNTATSTTDPTTGGITTTNTLTPTQQAAQTEVGNLGSTFKSWLMANFAVNPFIDLDQGTIVKIFVNADLQFPSDISSGINIIK